MGLTQITVSFIVNLIIVIVASRVAKLLGTRSTWLKVQRWLMATAFLAANLIFERRQ
ncbi:lysine transporter LysE [Lysinibacillus xylanilyticus]|uniref:Lysine transporter LysE n=1 Tax=Lysinibacillus xylanilyticus TaxID=582475 RepID=A0A2M9Q6G3_9BACI|nr:lysine transporter LysE [Lysinibacillus xylanilyticus]